MPYPHYCYSAHKLDSEINSGSCCKRRLLVVSLDCFSGLGIEERDSARSDLHAVSARVSSRLRIEGFFHAIHVVALELSDLVVLRIASRCANNLVNCILFESRHLLGYGDVVLPVLFVE